MNNEINVLIADESGIRFEKINEHYTEFNRLVRGGIGSCPLPPELRERRFYAFCDDDAIGRGQPDNPFARQLGHFLLKGPVVIFRQNDQPFTDDGELSERDAQPMSGDEVGYLLRYLGAEPTPEAEAMAAAEEQFWTDNPSGVAIFQWDPEKGEWPF